MARRKNSTPTAVVQSVADWRSIADDREKYQAYLCSREWAEKKQAVHKRAGGACERCKCFAISAVHHLTYARKYNELLEDLQAHCEFCHEFTHGKSAIDPAGEHKTLFQYLLFCYSHSRTPAPPLVLYDPFPVRDDWRVLIAAIDAIHAIQMAAGVGAWSESLCKVTYTIDGQLPFDYVVAKRMQIAARYDCPLYKEAIGMANMKSINDDECCSIPEEDEQPEVRYDEFKNYK